MRAAVYTRISSDPSGQKAGVARQEKEARALVEARGWTLTNVYSDNDTSAYSGKPRPEYHRLMGDIEAGHIDALVAWHPDRLHRSPTELETFIDTVEKAGVTVQTVQGGSYDLSTASGRMTARVVGAVARHESEHKAERHRAKHYELAQEGKPSGGGTRPFGFESDGVTIREPEAEVLREATSRLLAGESIRSIIAWLAENDITTTTGKEWRAVNFTRLLRSARIAGLRSHKGEVVSEAVWDAIIPADDWHRLQAIFEGNRLRVKRSPRKYLLTGGLAVCGLCGADLVARPKADGRRCYVCAKGPGFSGCGKIRQLADPFEELVIESVIEAASGPTLAEAIAQTEHTDTSTLLDDIATLEARLEQLSIDHYSDGVISRSQFFAAKSDLDSKIDALRDTLLATTRSDIDRGMLGAASPDSLTEAFETHDLAWRRQFISVMVEKVVVAPAVKGRNFFDPDRLTIVWKA